MVKICVSTYPLIGLLLPITVVTSIYVLNTVNTPGRKGENMCVYISINWPIVTHYRGYKHIRP